jgi:hypothetical protein
MTFLMPPVTACAPTSRDDAVSSPGNAGCDSADSEYTRSKFGCNGSDLSHLNRHLRRECLTLGPRRRSYLDHPKNWR